MRHVALPIIFLVASCSDRAAEEAVKKALMDPESAQFSAIATKGNLTCGLVNSKNRMGGYAGAVGFMVENGWAEIESPPDLEFQKKFFDRCPDPANSEFLTMSIHRQSRELGL